ncbi:MAG: septation protein A [Rhodobacteraceae bacterium]|jgi:intracellular septation protein|nr:septation protein A [Paracoccaceae bacterium]MBT6271873.1 septation protein A [Paracoccaceae bacterium]MBT6436909.1 septation protein A [Paracoccaceae bacterium]MDG2374285.1 septation protein A [Paracoccaceae bacterium]
MKKRDVNPVLKFLLELGPLIIFFIIYGRIKDKVFSIFGVDYQGFIIATGVFIPILLLSILVLWILSGKIAKMQLITALLVVIFGGLTIWFNDDRFFKMKPTIIYLLFGGILSFGLLRKKSYLEYVMEDMLPLERIGWVILTKRVAIFFLSLALLNELIWRNMSTDSWVNFKTFGLTGAIFIFFVAQNGLIQKYGKTSQK